MTTIDKKRYIEPPGPASFQQDGWEEQIISGEDLARLKARLAKYGCLIVAGVVLLVFGLVQAYIDFLEQICLVCFGR